MRWPHALLGLIALTAACVNAPLANIEAGSSVHLVSRVGQCTAFHIGEGQVLTAWHCNRSSEVLVAGQPAVLQWDNQKYDVTLFFVPSLKGAPASTLACRPAIVGEAVVAIADTNWGTDIHTFGRVALVHEEAQVILLDLVVTKGNSGAPVYATDGRIIAMLIGLLSDYGNMGVAVSSTILCALVEGKGKLVGR